MSIQGKRKRKRRKKRRKSGERCESLLFPPLVSWLNVKKERSRQGREMSIGNGRRGQVSGEVAEFKSERRGGVWPVKDEIKWEKKESGRVRGGNLGRLEDGGIGLRMNRNEGNKIRMIGRDFFHVSWTYGAGRLDGGVEWSAAAISLEVQIRFFKVTPRFLLRGSCCPGRLFIAFYVAVPVEDSVMAACGWSLATAVFPKKSGQLVPGLKLGTLSWYARTLATRSPPRKLIGKWC